jgi:hypothetical protein
MPFFTIEKKSRFLMKDMLEISEKGYKPCTAGPTSQLASEKICGLHIQADIAKEFVWGCFLARIGKAAEKYKNASVFCPFIAIHLNISGLKSH